MATIQVVTKLLLGVLLGGLSACGEAAVFTYPQQTESILPPFSGGTLLVTKDDSTVVAADADRNAIWLIDTASQSVRRRVQLRRGSEPGRLLETADGTIYAVLRRAGQLAKIDPIRGVLEKQIDVCPAPRGIAYRAEPGTLYVACAGGELLTIDERHDKVESSWLLDTDLRDVVLWGDHLLVSRFRTAEVLEVSATGTLLNRVKPPQVTTYESIFKQGPVERHLSATTAWRMLPLPSGEALLLHQRALDDLTVRSKGVYTGRLCGSGVVAPSLTLVGDSGSVPRVSIGATLGGRLILDVAVSGSGQRFALIEAAGSAAERHAGVPYPSIWAIERSQLQPAAGCGTGSIDVGLRTWNEAPIAGAYDSKDQLWIQTDAATVYRVSEQTPHAIALRDAEPVDGAARRLFHIADGVQTNCVLCHPEATDDAHVWNFVGFGLRRTQRLRRDFLATAPFHWGGQLADFPALISEVFPIPSGGAELTQAQIDALGTWLDQQPALPKSAPRDPKAVARGQKLFEDPTVGCAKCHAGPQLTNNQTQDVGTGQALQVPSLLDIGLRDPYLHNGCAATLSARFSPACGGGDKHGQTSQLTDGEIGDLAAYLRTL